MAGFSQDCRFYEEITVFSGKGDFRPKMRGLQ